MRARPARGQGARSLGSTRRPDGADRLLLGEAERNLGNPQVPEAAEGLHTFLGRSRDGGIGHHFGRERGGIGAPRRRLSAGDPHVLQGVRVLRAVGDRVRHQRPDGGQRGRGVVGHGDVAVEDDPDLVRAARRPVGFAKPGNGVLVEPAVARRDDDPPGDLAAEGEHPRPARSAHEHRERQHLLEQEASVARGERHPVHARPALLQELAHDQDGLAAAVDLARQLEADGPE